MSSESTSHRRMTGPSRPEVSLCLKVDGRDVEFTGVGARARTDLVRDGYRLRASGGDALRVSVRRADGGEMSVDCLEVRFTVPLLNFSKVIVPDTGREYVLKDRALLLRSLSASVSAPNAGHPFMALVDQAGDCRWSFGLVSWLRESTCRCLDPRLSSRKAMLGGHDVLTMSFRLPSEGWRYGETREVREVLWRAGAAKSWFHALRRYAGACRRWHRIRYPVRRAALEPTWCTWTAFPSDRLSDRTVIENARIARDIGVKTIILDDGWFGPGLDTDDRPLNIGDYGADPGKFPDLAGLVRALRETGLAVLLWYAPTCVSPDSRVFDRVRGFLFEDESGKVLTPNGFYNLCPCNPAARRHVSAEVAHMLDEYDADGLKVDLFNTLPSAPCRASHEHDGDSVIEGMRRMMNDIWVVLRRRRRKGLLELKQNYANVLSARFGTMVRAGDTAYDVDTALQRCFYTQAYAPVTHNDYLACSIHDSPRDVAVMMVKMLAGGVPTFSLDLTRQPPQNLDVMRAWLGFYGSHLDDFARAREPQDVRLDVWQMGGPRRVTLALVAGACEVRLPASKRTEILNGTVRDEIRIRLDRPATFRAVSFDHCLCRLSARRRRLADGDRLEIARGGRISLERA